MAAATQEVASHVQRTADTSQEVNVLTGRGRDIAKSTPEAIQQLSVVVGETRLAATRIVKNCNEIGTVVDVIKVIADQTNLLALNAAIKTVRAGEMGHGVNVLAGEVHKLEQRTSESTSQIHALITKLPQSSSSAVLTMGLQRRPNNAWQGCLKPNRH